MSSIIEFFAKVRWNINFIAEEIEKIPSSQKTKEQISNICNTISSDVLHKIGDVDDEHLMAELNQQLEKFHSLISEIENNDDEEIAYVLLITHVADILSLIEKERQK